VVVRLEKSEISMLVSLVTLEIERRHEGEEGTSSYCQRLRRMRDKLLSTLSAVDEAPDVGSDGLPEFREYARRKYSAELDEDLVTMVEDLIQMRRQGVR